MAMIRRTGQSEEFVAIIDLREIGNELELLRVQDPVQIGKEIVDRADLLDRRSRRRRTLRRGQILMEMYRCTRVVVRRRTNLVHSNALLEGQCVRYSSTLASLRNDRHWTNAGQRLKTQVLLVRA